MAVVSRLSDVVKPGIVSQDTQEGLAVVVTNSGVLNGFANDLPMVQLAASGATQNIYMVFAAPDNFPHPVDLRQYRAGWYSQLSRNDSAYNPPVVTSTVYNVGLSNLYNPVIPSGVLVNLHRGGSYTIQANSFWNTSNIQAPGAKIKIGASGKWEYTNSTTDAVGEVDAYYADTQELAITLRQ